MDSLKNLCEKIGYQFKNIDLLYLALRHRSAPGESNERLEFLGDSILNFIIAAKLYEMFPKAKEGELSRLRASLVRRETLAALAQEFELSRYISLGVGETRSGGSERSSIQANTVEAIIGAIYKDSGFDAAQDRVLAWFDTRLKTLTLKKSMKDSKTQLQEYLQSKQLPLPKYNVKEIKGKAHEQLFCVECSVKGLEIITMGEGMSRRKAEQKAAALYLQEIAKSAISSKRG